MPEYDVIVVGAGNVALAAVVSAWEQGATNYPGGTGLMSGAVLGRLAGAAAGA